MATGLAVGTHPSAKPRAPSFSKRDCGEKKNAIVVDEKEKEGEGGKRKGHASDTDQCSVHKGQFIKIIKPSLVLKVKPTINLTCIQKEKNLCIVRQINKTNALLCQCPHYYPG